MLTIEETGEMAAIASTCSGPPRRVCCALASTHVVRLLLSRTAQTYRSQERVWSRAPTRHQTLAQWTMWSVFLAHVHVSRTSSSSASQPLSGSQMLGCKQRADEQGKRTWSQTGVALVSPSPRPECANVHTPSLAHDSKILRMHTDAT
jgi:hypothetical protein